jgi:hypothetical protein
MERRLILRRPDFALRIFHRWLQSWQTTYPQPGTSLVSSNVTVYAGSGLRYSTNLAFK